MISTFWGAHELYKGLRFQMGPALASSKKNWRSWSKITQALTRPLSLLWIVPSGTSAVLSTTIAFHSKIICHVSEVTRRCCISRVKKTLPETGLEFMTFRSCSTCLPFTTRFCSWSKCVFRWQWNIFHPVALYKVLVKVSFPTNYHFGFKSRLRGSLL